MDNKKSNGSGGGIILVVYAIIMIIFLSQCGSSGSGKSQLQKDIDSGMWDRQETWDSFADWNRRQMLS